MNSDDKNTLQGSSGNACKTLTKYAKSPSPSRQSRLDPKLSLAVKQRPTLYLQLMAPSAIEGVVAALQKRKGVRPYGVSSDILQTGGSAAAVQPADRIRGRRDIAMSDSKRSIKGGESMTITLRHKRKNYFFKRYTGQNDSSVGRTPSFQPETPLPKNNC